ncbi:hypothetical protein [Desulfuromonas sp. CSMB_57]|jgi:rubrerythrin|uniref:hypothetical protein n=1 Tax=Desulfuromonas sp. CSMB_57 TaxID=2807629 RepID=UPI001CD217C6|nr:hypothetical protein [Desulfuromonas sp. CSMB_57]
MKLYAFLSNMEQEAASIYGTLARQTTGQGMKQLLADLAMDRLQRHEILQNTACPGRTLWDQDGPFQARAAGLYQKLLGLRAPCGDRSHQLDCCQAVLELETQTMAFYNHLAEQTGNEALRPLLKQSTEQESRDLLSIQQLYDFVNAPNQYLAWAESSNLEEFHQFGRDVD